MNHARTERTDDIQSLISLKEFMSNGNIYTSMETSNDSAVTYILCSFVRDERE